MGQSLRVLHNSSWSTIEAPYVMTDGVWRTVHKVWVMHSGAWKESHKTAYTKYSYGSGGLGATQVNGTWTVPDNTRYIEVIIHGHGGGGGGASKSNAHYFNSGSYQWSTYVNDYAHGGNGGSGAYAKLILETKPGTVFTWDYMSYEGTYAGNAGGKGSGGDNYTNGQTQGGGGTGNLSLRNEWASFTSGPATSVGTYQQALSGDDASDIRFYGDSPTPNSPYSVTVGGGKKGTGGKLTVAAVSNHPIATYSPYHPKYGYSVTETNGTNGANGTATLTASGGSGNLVYQNLVTGGGRSGGAGGDSLEVGVSGVQTDTAPDGAAGTTGQISISTYQGL